MLTLLYVVLGLVFLILVVVDLHRTASRLSALEVSSLPQLPPVTVAVSVPGPRQRTSRSAEGTLRLSVALATPRRPRLQVGREAQLPDRVDVRLRVHLRRDLDLVVQASDDLGFVESVHRLGRAAAAVARLLPRDAPRSLEVTSLEATLHAHDALTSPQQQQALRDLAEVVEALARPSAFGDQAPSSPRVSLPLRQTLQWARGRLHTVAPRAIVPGQGQITARRRAAGPLRCAFCHDGFEATPARCPGCDTAVHDDCKDELRRCPTAGCRSAA